MQPSKKITKPPQKQQDFDKLYDQLTARQKEVLIPFLDSNTDREIADKLSCTQDNVRQHVSKIIQAFGLRDSDSKGEHCRKELVDLFIEFRPELVSGAVAVNAGHCRRNSFDIPGCPVALNSQFYIPPNVITRCREEIMTPGRMIRIRAPQMTGKTSVLYRILDHARQNNYHTIALNLRYDLGTSHLTSFATLISWFLGAISRRLNLPDTALPTTHLDCNEYLQNQILLNLDMPLVIALDEVEVLFDHQAIAQEFFPLIRGWHESAKEPGLEKIWEKLRLVIVHSTDTYIHFSSSPFQNIGYVVGYASPQEPRLSPFSTTQVKELAKKYGLRNFTEAEVNQLIYLVGGHPYLIQQALYSLAQHNIALDTLLAEASTLSGIYRSHLRELSIRLKALPQENLIETLKQVATAESSVRLSPEQAFKLVGLGLVESQGNLVRISCELYRRFLQDWL